MKSTRNTARFSVKSKKNGNPAKFGGIVQFVEKVDSAREAGSADATAEKSQRDFFDGLGNPASVCGVAFLLLNCTISLPFISGNMCAVPNVGI